MPTRNNSAAIRKAKNAVATRAAILAAAVEEFAERGFEGARIDAVARNTKTTRAMVYYYYKSKEGLYLAVLDGAYQGIRDSERMLDLEHTEPQEAIRRLVSFTFDYYQANPNFVKIVTAENQNGGRFIRRMSRMQRRNRSIVRVLDDVLQRGAQEGVTRSGLDAVEVHMLIASLGWFQIANRHTFGTLFGRDFASASVKARHKALIVDAVIRFVKSDPHSAQTLGVASHDVHRDVSATRQAIVNLDRSLGKRRSGGRGIAE